MNVSACLNTVKKGLFAVGRKLRPLFPMKGDGLFEIVRKSLFLVSAVVLVVSLGILIHESVVIPTSYNNEMEKIRDIYRPESSTPGDVASNSVQDPMRLNALREINSDTVGWLTFQSEEAGVDIDYPVLQGKDNDYYLNYTFYKKKNKTGSLFLDYRNQLTPEQDQALIIYGHNLSTGLMFSSLNKLVNNLYKARTATTFTFTTDAGTDTYLVFGIMISNAEPEQGPVFNYLRRNFDSAEDFNLYVEELRRRSLYDYPVDVNENDKLLLLSTCVPRRQTQYKGSRTVVMARKLREGESAVLNGTITTNKDCLYPLVYYVSKGMPIPNEYTSSTTHAPSASATTIPSGSFSPVGTVVTTPSTGVPGIPTISLPVVTVGSSIVAPSGTDTTSATGSGPVSSADTASGTTTATQSNTTASTSAGSATTSQPTNASSSETTATTVATTESSATTQATEESTPSTQASTGENEGE